MTLEQLKYPVGLPKIPKDISSQDIIHWINIIKEFPSKVENEIKGLDEKDQGLRYRPEGWTIKQVVSHCLDSHMNSLFRFKLTLTEENPTIRPYREDKWAELTDTLDYPLDNTLQMLKNLHQRWVFLLDNLTEKAWGKTFIHPDGNETISLKENIGIYAWHCEHHLQHIINAKQYKY